MTDNKSSSEEELDLGAAVAFSKMLRSNYERAAKKIVDVRGKTWAEIDQIDADLRAEGWVRGMRSGLIYFMFEKKDDSPGETDQE